MKEKRIIQIILIISISVAIISPLINIYFIYPSFTWLMIKDAEKQAAYTATHLASELAKERIELTKDSLPDWLKNESDKIKEDFNLMKIKVFSPLGEIIYSTDPKDIGEINKKSYFHEIVARGNNYTKFVQKETKSLEDQAVSADVVETYVPIMKANTFVGAFEVYYDITDRNQEHGELIFNFSIIPFAVMVGFLAVIIIGLFKLDRNITERKRAEEVLIESEEKFRSVVETANDAIISADSSGNIVSWNQGAQNIFCYSEYEVLGKPLTLLISKQYRGAYRNGMEQLNSTGESRVIGKTVELPGLKKGGQEFPLELSLTTWGSGGKIFYTGIIRDISEHKGAEERIERHLKQLSALRSIDLAITASLDLRISSEIILEHTQIQLKADAADILLYEPHLQMLRYVAGHGFKTQALQYTRLKLGESYAGKAALEQRIVHIPDLREGDVEFKRSGYLSEEGFISYYGVPLIAKGEVKGVLEVFNRTRIKPDKEWLDFLETLAGQAAIAIDNATLFDDLQRSNKDIVMAYDETIEGWSRALDLRDKETEGHSQRVTELTLRIASEMGVSKAEQAHMRRGALLHDIGKMGIPDGILNKPGPLDDREWEVMQKHSELGYQLLAPIKFLRPAVDIPYCHHEKWDGTGYPRGLKGEQIPLAARIFAVADIYDALCSERPYRPGWPKEKAIEHIRSLAGNHLDPKVVEEFLNLEKDTST